MADWTPWKPTSWLLADVETGSGASYAPAVKELENRVAAHDANQAKVNAIIDIALAHQKDRTTKWNRDWAEIIQSAGQANHLSADRANRYLEQSVNVTLRVRPKVRRERYASLELTYGIDRLATFSLVRCTWHVSPLMIDSVDIADRVFSNSSEEQEFGVGGTNSYGTGMPLTEKKLIGLKDGKHQLTATYEQTLRQTAPFAAGPVTVRIPLSAPIELFPKDAIVDEFKADPFDAPRELAAERAARVFHSDGKLEVRLKTDALPVALAVKVVLTQGQAREDVGELVISAGQNARWTGTAAWQHKSKQFAAGKVDLHLIPDQDASDYQQDMGTYWGKEIVIRNITIDAPYHVPFNTDESLRAAVEKALTVESITRGKESSAGGRLQVSCSANSPPVKLAYWVYLSFGGREMQVGDSYRWIVSKGANSSFGLSCDDVNPPAVRHRMM